MVSLTKRKTIPTGFASSLETNYVKRNNKKKNLLPSLGDPNSVQKLVKVNLREREAWKKEEAAIQSIINLE